MNYALYRLPYSDYYTEIRSERKPLIISSFEEIGEEEGFIIAPFVNSPDKSPIVLICPDNVKRIPIDTIKAIDRSERIVDANITASYEEDFKKFHDAAQSGEFQKLVLSRSKKTENTTSDYLAAFTDACHSYPRLMVMLVSTEETGTWLVASPERLLSGDGNYWRTMALAGTMPYKEGFQDWSSKNQREQQYVDKYIDECVSSYSEEIIKDGPHTKRAGNLVHLCTDFRFRLNRGVNIGEVLSALHPTPAVCGIPKEKALDFILTNEHNDRLYYTGFMGPVGISNETHLYVSLRCAKLNATSSTLYSGGGIMPDSDLNSEWEETEKKMQTIENVLR